MNVEQLEQELDLLEAEIEEGTISLCDFQKKFHRIEKIRLELQRHLIGDNNE